MALPNSIKDFISDADRVYTHLSLSADERQVVAVKDIKILVPKRFVEAELASLDNEVIFLGMVMYVVEDKYYAVSRITAMMRSEPTVINNATIDDQEFFELSYEPGAIVITNTNLVKTDNLMFKVFDEIQQKGRIPTYYDDADIEKLFLYSTYHAGITIGADRCVAGVVTAHMFRSAADDNLFYRQSLKKWDEVKKDNSVSYGLRVVNKGANSVITKLAGNYLEASLTEALLQEPGRVERGEAALLA